MSSKPSAKEAVRLSLANRLLVEIRRKALLLYYRYSVEVGVSTLETWEAFIINSLFLLLLASIATQCIKGIANALAHAKHIARIK